MLRALLLAGSLLAAVWSHAQGAAPIVTAAQLDAAVAKVNAGMAEDDPQRGSLLKKYSDARAALDAIQQYQQARDTYGQARTGAARQAAAIEAGLEQRQLASTALDRSFARATLPELEQQLQVSRAELEALKSKLADIRAGIAGMPGRAVEIRNRLTVLGGLIPDLQSQLALLPTTVASGSGEEADLWLTQATAASAVAEKAALDEELLSQPMRLQLLTARQDRASQDIGGLERQIQAMERRATALRQGEASQAHAEAEKVVAGAQGKHKLVQQLADENAALSASFGVRGDLIEAARQREQKSGDHAEQLETDLNAIERRLSVLGMSISVGQILREQQVQLPKERDIKRELTRVGTQAAVASARQMELEDERRRLQDAGGYVDKLESGLDEVTAREIRPDLLDLAQKRRDLVRQALDLENLYSAALGSLQYTLHRYASVVSRYRHFIQERLLWIPSRDPFSLFRADVLPAQLAQVFSIAGWKKELQRLPGELMRQPLQALALLLVLVLVYYSPRIRERIVASGREVGYVRTDTYSSTVLALGLSFLLSLKWPLLMWAVSRLFEMQENESDLGVALHTALAQGAMYFWGLEFLRVITMPKGLLAAHFRWPTERAGLTHRRVLVLEQTFLPSVLVVSFSLALYPREVGGPLGALAVICLLLSMAYFFRYMPQYLQGKVSMLLTDRLSSGNPVLGRVMRQLLIWVPLATTIAVLFGYIYTAMVFSLLLIKTAAVCALVLLGNEMAMRWLRMARRRMIVRARADAAQASGNVGDVKTDDEISENDPELLGDEGTKLINLLTLLGLLLGVLAIWAQVLPALGILDSVELWHQSGVVDGQQVPVPVTLADLVTALLIATLGWIVLRRIPGLLEILLRQRMGVRAASAYAATRVFQYAATGALVIGVLGSLGGSWSQIQWAVAALSVGIGFGLQEIVANFISGLIILFEQPVRVGDVVTVGNVSGTVTKIRIRATTIRDFDRRELLVPNKEFITQQLLNWSLSDQVTRSTIEVGVAYGTDLDRAMAEVREAALQHPLILKDPEPIVTFEAFGDNSLLIRVRFFMDQLDKRLPTTSELMLDINRRLNAAGIVVAFPQRDVHLDASAPLEVRVVGARQEGPAGAGTPPGS